MNKSSTKILLTTFFVLIFALSQNISTIGIPGKPAAAATPTINNPTLVSKIRTMVTLPTSLSSNQINNINRKETVLNRLCNDIDSLKKTKPTKSKTQADINSEITSKLDRITAHINDN